MLILSRRAKESADDVVLSIKKLSKSDADKIIAVLDQYEDDDLAKLAGHIRGMTTEYRESRVRVVLVEVDRGKSRLGFEADPGEVRVMRGEIQRDIDAGVPVRSK